MRCLSLVGDLMKWIESSGSKSKVADIDEGMVERYLRNRARKHSIHRIDRPALKRFVSVLRKLGMIAPAEPLRITPQDQILVEFSDHLSERGLAPRSIVRHLPVIRRLLREVCSAMALGAVSVTAAAVRNDSVAALLVLAARNKAAERSRAAALDGTHDLQLLQADMAAVGVTPSGTVRSG